MSVVGVTGHQDIPAAASAFIEEGVVRVLRPLRRDFTGVSSLAAGADQLFAEIVLRLGGRLHAVIPCRGYQNTFTDDGHVKAFRRLLESADLVETLEYSGPSEEAFLESQDDVSWNWHRP